MSGAPSSSVAALRDGAPVYHTSRLSDIQRVWSHVDPDDQPVLWRVDRVQCLRDDRVLGRRLAFGYSGLSDHEQDPFRGRSTNQIDPQPINPFSVRIEPGSDPVVVYHALRSVYETIYQNDSVGFLVAPTVIQGVSG